MSMDLFIARTVITKASLVFQGPVEITETQVDKLYALSHYHTCVQYLITLNKSSTFGFIQLASLKSFHVRLMSIVLDVDVEPSTTPWDTAKAYLFVPIAGGKSGDPVKGIDWDLVEKITRTDAWNNPLQRARPDVFLGTNERALGGDRREYGFGKLRHGLAFGLKSHPTYGIRGAVAQFDVVKASGLVPSRLTIKMCDTVKSSNSKLVMFDCCSRAEELIGRIVTAAHSGKRFYVDSVRYEMTAESSFPRKEGYLGPLEYSTYADYYKLKYASISCYFGLLCMFSMVYGDSKEGKRISIVFFCFVFSSANCCLIPLRTGWF